MITFRNITDGSLRLLRVYFMFLFKTVEDKMLFSPILHRGRTVEDGYFIFNLCCLETTSIYFLGKIIFKFFCSFFPKFVFTS